MEIVKFYIVLKVKFLGKDLGRVYYILFVFNLSGFLICLISKWVFWMILVLV